MLDFLYYFIIVLYIISILKSVKKHNKVILKDVIKSKNNVSLDKNVNLSNHNICVNNNTYYLDNGFVDDIYNLQNIQYNRPLINQI